MGGNEGGNLNNSHSSDETEENSARKELKAVIKRLYPNNNELYKAFRNANTEFKNKAKRILELETKLQEKKDDIVKLEGKLEDKSELVGKLESEKRFLETKSHAYELILGSRQRFEELRKKIIPVFIRGNELLTNRQKLYISFDLRVTRMSRILMERFKGTTLSITDLINGQEKLYETFSNPIHKGICPRIPSTEEEWKEVFDIATAIDAEEQITLKLCLPGSTEQELEMNSVSFVLSSYVVHVKQIPKQTSITDLNTYLVANSFSHLKIKTCIVYDSSGRFFGEMYLYIQETTLSENDLYNLLKNEQIGQKAVFITTHKVDHLLM